MRTTTRLVAVAVVVAGTAWLAMPRTIPCTAAAGGSDPIATVFESIPEFESRPGELAQTGALRRAPADQLAARPPKPSCQTASRPTREARSTLLVTVSLRVPARSRGAGMPVPELLRIGANGHTRSIRSVQANRVLGPPRAALATGATTPTTATTVTAQFSVSEPMSEPESERFVYQAAWHVWRRGNRPGTDRTWRVRRGVGPPLSWAELKADPRLDLLLRPVDLEPPPIHQAAPDARYTITAKDG